MQDVSWFPLWLCIWYLTSVQISQQLTVILTFCFVLGFLFFKGRKLLKVASSSPALHNHFHLCLTLNGETHWTTPAFFFYLLQVSLTLFTRITCTWWNMLVPFQLSTDCLMVLHFYLVIKDLLSLSVWRFFHLKTCEHIKYLTFT